jgi:hypothetical protein
MKRGKEEAERLIEALQEEDSAELNVDVGKLRNEKDRLNTELSQARMTIMDAANLTTKSRMLEEENTKLRQENGTLKKGVEQALNADFQAKELTIKAMAKDEARPSSELSPVSVAAKTEMSSDEAEAPKPTVKTGLRPKDSTAEVIKPNEAPGLKTKPVEEALAGNTHKLKLKPVDKDEKNEAKDAVDATIKSKFAKSLFGAVKAPKSKKK